MSFSISRTDMVMAFLPQIVLGLAALALLIACFVVNNRAIKAASEDNMPEMKKQVVMLRNLMWAFYAVYLICFFMHVYNPVIGMFSGRNQWGIIALLLTTALAVGATHLNSACTSDACDKKNALASLESLNIILSVFTVIMIGTNVIVMFGGEKRQISLTRELMDMLKSAPIRSRRSEKSFF